MALKLRAEDYSRATGMRVLNNKTNTSQALLHDFT